jgi:hypothetical protein
MVKKILKYELQDIIFGNERLGEKNLIQAATYYLRASKRANTNAQKSEFIKEQEEQLLIPFIEANHWFKRGLEMIEN